MEAEPTMPTSCDRCGKMFNTSRERPRRYCSIACEEGRSPLPISDPASEGYHLHLQAEPEALVGQTLVASALKRTCYSPDWHRNPDAYNRGQIVSHDEENETLVYKTDVVIGKVVDYDPHDGTYYVNRNRDDVEKGIVEAKHINASATVSQIRQGEWWVDG